MNNEFIGKLLEYYKKTLETQEQIKQKINKSNFVTVESDMNEHKKFVVFGIKNKDSYNLVYNFCERFLNDYNSKEKYDFNKKTFGELFEITFSPLMINVDDLFINPFYLKVANFENLQEILIALEENDLEKNVFKGEEVLLNPLMLIEPFELLDLDLSDRLFKTLDKRNSNNRIDNVRQFFELIMDSVNSWLDKEYKIEQIDFKRAIEGLFYSLMQLQNAHTKNKDKNIKKMENPHVVIKLLTNNDDININGLLNVYKSVEQATENGSFNEDNLLYYYLAGSKHKHSPVPFEEIKDDEHSVVLDYKKIKSYTREHLGALTSDYDLTDSQKYSLLACKSHLKVIPINGPPGTGKTSLLRAVIGDIIVHNAIESYNHFLKTKEINFNTPIISFSSINKALSNVAKGIIEVFDSLEKEKELLSNDADFILHQRWINPEISYFEKIEGKNEKKTIDINKGRLFAPLFKSSSKIDINMPYESEINWKSLEYLNSYLIGNYNEQIAQYLNNFNRLELGFRMPLENLLEFKEQSLEMALEYMYIKLNEYKFAIETKADKIKVNSDYKRFNKLLEEIILFQNASPLVIQTRTQFESYCKHLDLKLKLFYDKYSTVTKNIKLIEEELIRKIRALEREREAERENEEKLLLEEMNGIICTIDKVVESLEERLNNDKQEVFLNKEDRVKEIDKNFSGIINKVKEFFTHERSALIASVESDYQGSIEDMEKTFKKQKNEFIEKSNSHLSILRGKFDEVKKLTESKYKDIINEVHRDFSVLIKEEKEKYSEATVLFQLHELEHNKAFSQVEKFSKTIAEFRNIDIEFFNEFTKRLNGDFIGDDLKIRTKAMFLSLHILEGLLLLEITRESDITRKQQIQRCFSCSKQTLTNISTKDTDKYKCGSCGAIFVNHNLQKLGRPLSKQEVVQVLTFKKVIVNGEMYSLRRNTSEGKEQFWNVVQSDYMTNDTKLHILKKASVLFPVLNTTCHSFGTMFSISSDKTIPSSFIEHLFVDEAGMMLAPYLVNLFAGKKVFLFGDELQIEPIYPFSENPIIYQYLLNRYFRKDEDRKKVQDLYSIESSNAMKIANSAVTIHNPMYKIDLPGDVWLLDHFRCRRSIIEYSNKEFYNNYMIPMVDDKQGAHHLRLLNHDFNSEKDGTSRINKDEASLIVSEILKDIKDIKRPTEDEIKYLRSIGIITPYKAQSAILKQKLVEHKLVEYIRTGTVHTFQGSEQDIIYFSTTVGINNRSSNDTYMINVSQPNVINVAITRAKEKFILVGNTLNLQLTNGSYTSKLVEHIESVHSNKML